MRRYGTTFALYASFFLHWRAWPPEKYLEVVLDRLAFAARYASMPPAESVHCDVQMLNAFLSRVGRMISEENKPRSS